MAFENDVFVSYSHFDDESPVTSEEGRWITALHRWLEARLPQVLGKAPKIWRDPQLRGNEPFGEVINLRLPNVAVFISVVSPPYLKSQWCRHELEQFLAMAPVSGGVRVAENTRVFKVVKWPVERQLEPPLLQTMRGYEFYTIEAQTGRVRELGPLSPPAVLLDYYAKLDDLVRDVARILASLDGSESDAAPAPPPNFGYVYLAETSMDLQDRRDRIRRDLQDHGYVVLPDEPMPLGAPDCLSFIRAQMDRCRLSIHMVGSTYGVVPDGATQSIIQLQHEEALRRAAAGDFCRLVWMPADVTTTDPRQEAFLAELEADPRADAGSDLLKSPLEDFKTVVHKRLAPPAASRSLRAGSAELKHVYVICDQRDREAVRPLQKLLFSEGLEVMPSMFDGDEENLLRYHKENLANCDAALIYYGASEPLWFQNRTSELRKIAAFRKPAPVKAVVLEAPFTPDKLDFSSHEFIVINAGAALDAEPFRPFLALLR